MIVSSAKRCLSLVVFPDSQSVVEIFKIHFGKNLRIIESIQRLTNQR